jgi:O-antigen/teichoic acid export membrane protein
VRTTLLWSVAGWKPDFKFSMAEVKKVSSFSTYVFLDHAVSRVFQRLDILILGKLFSPATLGYYSRAETMRDQVAHYSSSSIRKAFFPILSSLQENDERFKEVYFKLLSVICFISFGLTGVLFFLGNEIITILYGSRWAPCAEMFQILILAGVNRPINSISVVSLLGKGLAKENFYMGLYRKTFALAPFLFLFISLEAYLWAMVFFAYFLTASIIFFADRHIGIDKYRSLLIVLRYGGVFFAGIPIFYLLEKIFPQSLFAWVFTFVFVTIYIVVHKMTDSVGFAMFLDVARDRLQSLFKKMKKVVR